jgi:CO/xanthine dehydrogenase Mo-binding subunit
MIKSGDAAAALATAHTVVEGELYIGGQEVLAQTPPCASTRQRPEATRGCAQHFYLEPQTVLAVPADGEMSIISSTQNLAKTQKHVAEVLGMPATRVPCSGAARLLPRVGLPAAGTPVALKCGPLRSAAHWRRLRRQGDQARPRPRRKRAFAASTGRHRALAAARSSIHFACLAAVAAKAANAPVRLCLGRDDDMIMTGKRHPFKARARPPASLPPPRLALGTRVSACRDGARRRCTSSAPPRAASSLVRASARLRAAAAH